MSTTATPYGLKPVNRVDGLPYSGAFRQIKIASGYASNIYNGSIVSIVAAGTIEMVTTVGSTAGDVFPVGTVGVFVGCQYTDPNLGYLVQKQFWPTGVVASDAVAFVVDDPNALFMIQCAGSLAQTTLGSNAVLNAVQSTTTGSTLSGNSNTALSATTNTTNTFGFRIVDFVASTTSKVGDAFTDVLVKFNPSSHAYLLSTGI